MKSDQVMQQLLAHGHAFHGLEAIGSIVKQADPHSHAELIAAVQVIARVVETILAGFDGKIDPAEIEKHLAVLPKRLTERAAESARKLDEKFGNEDK